MGSVAVLQNNLLSPTDQLLAQRQVSFCATPITTRYKALSGVANSLLQRYTSHRYQAVSGIANLPLKPFLSRGYRPVSRPLSQHKLRATLKEEAYQEVHDYIVLFKVPQYADCRHTA